MAASDGLFDRTFRFGQMETRRELAAAAVGQHVREEAQDFLRVEVLEVERAESRRIDDIRIAVEAHDFRMACRMAAALDLFADGADGQVFPAQDLGQQARLADARRAGKGRHAVGQQITQGIEAFAGLGRHEIDVIAAAFIKGLVGFGRLPVQVALIEAQRRMDAAVFTGHEHLIDEELVRIRRLGRHDDQELVDIGHGRRRLGRHDDQELVDIGHGRPAYLVAPGQQGFDDALVLAQLGDFQLVADEDLRFQQFAAASALDEPFPADIDVIIAVIVLDDASFCHVPPLRYTGPVLTNC